MDEKSIMIEEELIYKIRGAIFAVYKELGPGLLENIYEVALIYELKKRVGLLINFNTDDIVKSIHRLVL